MVTIVLADDHPMVIRGLHAVIGEETDLTVIGEAVTGAEALDMVKRLNPDVLILDILLPDINGIDMLTQLGKQDNATKVIMFSMHANDSYVRAALQAGAAGFVLKDSPAGELINAIREALDGRRYLSPAITDRAVDLFLQLSETQSTTSIDALTTRERQILQLVAQGATSATIASQLIISPRTVETHRANLMRKLNLKSHTELLRYAIAHGMPTETKSSS